ncbi:class I adenylate-forming enzyme family protein [Bacillus sp. FJAT-45350]|uniref:class I adenylate-forming enzyme family protein n=1 Tax=Bacillus sp. FJAT-45350 TaxID=2011014 RepID=UPI000BB948F6|nr:long-chain-fatty-acid--CoA ligase [Bacillus sp. FJAT-45350]
MNISNLLSRNGRKFSDSIAIVEGETSKTYRQLDDEVNRFASSLRNLGVVRGNKVMLFLPNTSEFIISYLATLRLGAIAVPVNARLTAKELTYIIEHSDATAVICHQALFEGVKDLPKSIDLIWIKTGEKIGAWESFMELLEVGASAEIVCSMKEDDEATILYTSGTTGNPKGVVFTYRNILSVSTMMCVETEMKSESRIMHMMPLSHSAPLHLFFISGLYVGATHVLAPTFTPDLLLSLTKRERITHFFGAPVAYLLTANHPKMKEADLSSVKYWVYGGAPLSSQEITFLQNAFSSNRFMCVYGLTEAGPNGTFLSPAEHEEKAGSIGKRAALNCEIKIVDAHGEEVKEGHVGEIALYGEGNMKGYYKDKERTSETYRNGWLLTGDMAKKDEDGFIWVVDRKKDMIISGGVNVFPKEIEDRLKVHPSNADVAVIGVPHNEWGESIKAVIVLKEEVPNVEEECKRFLSNELAKYKIPHLYEVVKELPRNPTGKILKQELRKKEALS